MRTRSLLPSMLMSTAAASIAAAAALPATAPAGATRYLVQAPSLQAAEQDVRGGGAKV